MSNPSEQDPQKPTQDDPPAKEPPQDQPPPKQYATRQRVEYVESEPMSRGDSKSTADGS